MLNRRPVNGPPTINVVHSLGLLPATNTTHFSFIEEHKGAMHISPPPSLPIILPNYPTQQIQAQMSINLLEMFITRISVDSDSTWSISSPVDEVHNPS